MPKMKPIMEAVKSNAESSLGRLKNIGWDDADADRARHLAGLLKDIIAIADGKQPPPKPEPFVCRFTDTCRLQPAGDEMPPLAQQGVVLTEAEGPEDLPS